MLCTLANGATWKFSASDKAASSAVARLAATLQLTPGTRAIPPRSIVDVEISTRAGVDAHATLGRPERWRLRRFVNQDQKNLRVMQISARFGASVLDHGGLLLHGAMAELAGRGVLLAGPGGSGKSTASRRLPSPWRSLSDDQTLVVHDDKGRFWAHPWPTWSRFLWGGSGGTWEVERAVPLAAIFFLEQAAVDEVRPIGQGEAACLGVEIAEQAAMHHLLTGAGLDLKRLRLQRFAAVEALVRRVPCHVLRLSLTGSFWNLLKEVLDAPANGAR